MKPATKILIVEHDVSDLELLLHELKHSGIDYTSTIVEAEQGYRDALIDFVPDIILSDYRLPTFDGPTAFKIRQELAPDTPFIFVSGTIGEENSIEYIKNGVTDYALKDKLFTLTTKILRALKEAKEMQLIKKAEQERILSESRLIRAQQVAHIGSWELNISTDVLLLSDEACRIFGLSTDNNKLAFETWKTLVHPEDIGYVSQTIKESQDALKDTSYYYRIMLKDGTVRHVYTESKFEIDSNGQPGCIYGIVHDVTEISRAEGERTKMVEDLRQRNKDLEQFAYIVSHNLRAPVANILGTANVLDNDGLGLKEKNSLSHGLNKAVTKLDDVIKDLNYILQVKGEASARKEKVCFSELVDDIKVSINKQITDTCTQITYNFFEINELFTLKSYLYSIFYNLISNSIKYRQQHLPGMIEIKSHQVKDKLELIFTDNGMGIDLEKRGEQVFGLYKRFHTNIEGKGMGLYMVKTQAEALGGKVAIKSEVNKGTEIKLEFKI